VPGPEEFVFHSIVKCIRQLIQKLRCILIRKVSIWLLSCGLLIEQHLGTLVHTLLAQMIDHQRMQQLHLHVILTLLGGLRRWLHLGRRRPLVGRLLLVQAAVLGLPLVVLRKQLLRVVVQGLQTRI